MKRKQTLFWGTVIIVGLWILSWILLLCFLPNPEKRGQFGDMFGAVNSLFSGLALCGVVYSILLQQEANRLSNYQFRFNHILDIVNKQTEIFNNRIMEFSFQDQNGNNLNFQEGIKFFKTIENNSQASRTFIERNKDTIYSILPFIYHSNKFTHNLIDEESISDTDKDRLKRLYFLNQNRSVIDYYSLNTEILNAENAEYESLSSDLKEIRKVIFDIRISMIKSISENDYR
jgi:hypothetical protein